MRKLVCACLVGAVALTSSAVFAGSRPMFKLFPKSKLRLTSYADPGAPTLGAPTLGAPTLEPSPMPSTNGASPGAQPVPVQGEPITLYHCVRYKDECNVAPCAVPMIVTVKDPCDTCDPCNPCATPKCVAVQICVPPCSECPPQVCCRRGGEYVCYDYGKYRVEITSRRGVVTVDYDD